MPNQNLNPVNSTSASTVWLLEGVSYDVYVIGNFSCLEKIREYLITMSKDSPEPYQAKLEEFSIDEKDGHLKAIVAIYHPDADDTPTETFYYVARQELIDGPLLDLLSKRV